MNKTILADKLFAAYQKLPHCVVVRYNHIKDVRSRFDYEHNSDISIIAANCVGGEIYSLLGLRFTSPLINISINRDQFIELCTDLKAYFSSELKVKRNNIGSCTGILGGYTLKPIEIRFPHDDDPVVVIEKWKKRCERVNYNKLALICDDKGLKPEDFEAYDNVSGYRKIMLTSQNHSYPWAFQMKEYIGQP